MRKILVAYDSKTGRTEKMAHLIAQGFQEAGHQVVALSISQIGSASDILHYDAYIFGSPTYFEQPTEQMKQFLIMARSDALKGKPGGSFGSYTHYGLGAQMVYDTMERIYQMDMLFTGPFRIKDLILDADMAQQACREYAIGISRQLK
jgi:multimeric flavodoxin WrbA